LRRRRDRWCSNGREQLWRFSRYAQGERSRRCARFSRQKPAREAAQCGDDFTARLIKSLGVTPVRTQAADRVGEIMQLVGVSHLAFRPRAAYGPVRR
jgi:hypothetical protein